MAKIYEQGEGVVVSWTFEDENGNPGDPDDVWLKWKDPATGSEVTKHYVLGNVDPEVVRDGAGKYHGTIVGSSPGPWYYRGIGQGGINDEKEGFFVIKIPFVTPGP